MQASCQCTKVQVTLKLLALCSGYRAACSWPQRHNVSRIPAPTLRTTRAFSRLCCRLLESLSGLSAEALDKKPSKSVAGEGKRKKGHRSAPPLWSSAPVRFGLRLVPGRSERKAGPPLLLGFVWNWCKFGRFLSGARRLLCVHRLRLRLRLHGVLSPLSYPLGSLLGQKATKHVLLSCTTDWHWEWE